MRIARWKRGVEGCVWRRVERQTLEGQPLVLEEKKEEG
jgi:hypothetical protein